MRRLEWLLIAVLALLVLSAAAVVVMGPHIEQFSVPSDEPLEPGETETMTGRVVEILEEGTVELGEGATQPYQRLQVRIEDGSMAGETVVVEEGTTNVVGHARLFEPGDRVFVERAVGPEQDRLYISDVIRLGPLLTVCVVFVALVVLVGRWKGLRSLMGSLLSLAVIFGFILPQIIAGRNPVVVSIVGSVVLLSVSTYLTYGANRKAHAAVVGMVISLALTGGLAWMFVGWTRLTGLGMEESAFLVMEFGPGIDLRGLVLGGIIIGSLGVLDDVCVGQASAVFELSKANPELGWLDLFQRSFNIGTDHIAAMVNTLLLAYVGGAMPLMLAFTIYQEPLTRRLNREPIAEEIVRTLVGSIGLVLAVPITGLVASLLAGWFIRSGTSEGEDEEGPGKDAE
ncbi:MAG: YibE/F family protein [Chloroflexota bacterium]